MNKRIVSLLLVVISVVPFSSCSNSNYDVIDSEEKFIEALKTTTYLSSYTANKTFYRVASVEDQSTQDDTRTKITFDRYSTESEEKYDGKYIYYHSKEAEECLIYDVKYQTSKDTSSMVYYSNKETGKSCTLDTRTEKYISSNVMLTDLGLTYLVRMVNSIKYENLVLSDNNIYTAVISDEDLSQYFEVGFHDGYVKTFAGYVIHDLNTTDAEYIKNNYDELDKIDVYDVYTTSFEIPNAVVDVIG